MKTRFCAISAFLSLVTVGCTDNTTPQTADNTVLITRQYPLPAAVSAKFKDAPVKKFEQTIQFGEVAAVVKLECMASVLNPTNSVLTSTKITLLQGAPNCSFSATADSAQFNEMNEQDMKTFALATVGYSKSKGGTYRLENKVCEIYSQGTIKVE